MKSLAKILILSFVLTTVITTLSGCNTVNGFGQDMSSGGHALSKSAQENS